MGKSERIASLVRTRAKRRKSVESCSPTLTEEGAPGPQLEAPSQQQLLRQEVRPPLSEPKTGSRLFKIRGEEEEGRSTIKEAACRRACGGGAAGHRGHPDMMSANRPRRQEKAL